MNQPHKPLIFVDSNVLIEGLLADYATAKAIVIFARHKKVNLITCKQVIADVEIELKEQAKLYKEFLNIFQCWQDMQKKINLKIVPDPSEADVLAVNNIYCGIPIYSCDEYVKKHFSVSY